MFQKMYVHRVQKKKLVHLFLNKFSQPLTHFVYIFQCEVTK